MVVNDDSDARMLRRLSSYTDSTLQKEPGSANITATAPAPARATPGLFRRAEEASNLTGPIKGPQTTVETVPVINLVPKNEKPPSPVYPVPYTPAPVPSTTVASTIAKTITVPIKTATPDIVLFDDSLVPIEVMADLIFEDIGGQELINIARTDTINGQKILYQPIKNINSINQEYNSNNILGLQKTSDKYFSGFAIKLDSKVPEISNSLDGNPAYFDASGNLVIDSINLNADEQIEIQISLSGTIYETEI